MIEAEVSGRLVVYRVFQVDSFEDRGEASPTWRSPERGDGMVVEATIGDLPGSFLRTWGRAVPLLASRNAQPARQNADEHRRMAEKARVAEDKVPEFLRPDHTYLTTAATRLATVEAIPGRRIWWVHDALATGNLMVDFGAYAASVLDLAAARMLGRRFENATVVHRTGVRFEPDNLDFAPAATSRLTGSAELSVSRRGWEAFTRDTVEPWLRELWDDRTSDSVVEHPAWWHFAARGEPDPLRRFLFAFWGLESLADRYGRAHRDDVIKRLEEAVEGMPARSLLWPAPEDHSDPHRSVEFRFALLAFDLAGSDARDDVKAFRKLAEIRNRMSHGGRVAPSRLPSDGPRLLQKYLALVNRQQE